MSARVKTIAYGVLENYLGYRFQDANLLRKALTHRSFSADHNERLEFLGDAVLETIISDYLFKYYQNHSEGELTRLRASVVCGSNLADIARGLKLYEFLHLGEGEMRSGGAKRESILEDALEAIIGAIYLDSDFLNVQKVVLELFAKSLDNLSSTPLKDAKSRLQEFLQGHNLALPQYELIDQQGPDHAKTFTVRLSSEAVHFTASGASRKKAEQNAAALMLAHYLREER